MLVEISGHVRLRALECAPTQPLHGARSYGHQAALLCAGRTAFLVCLRGADDFGNWPCAAASGSSRTSQLPDVRLSLRSADAYRRDSLASCGPQPDLGRWCDPRVVVLG